MLADFLNALLIWLQAHPELALLFIFLVAFFESLLIVGMLLPGAALMIAFGAFIALGALPAGPVLFASIAGAIAGDSISFWLGWHYKQTLKSHWPFSSYPDLFARGETFFHRHGGKSVMLGRFVGPLRAVVPAIAGMLAMPRARFFLVNAISACLWAPLYLLPGYLFGLSVEVASEFAGRFLLLFAVVIGIIWFTIFIVRQIYLWLVPFADKFFYRLMLWSQRHPLAGEIPAAIVNPAHRETRGLSLLALLLLLSSGLLIFLYEAIHIPLFSNISLLVQNSLLELHNPGFDIFMPALARLAEPAPALFSAAITLLWLLLYERRKHRLIIQHLLAIPLLPLLLMLLPHDSARLFSPDTILALSLYSFLLITLVRDIDLRWRMRIYAGGTALIMLVMFARFYLEQISLFQFFVELSLVTIWVSALGIAYRRHTLKHQHERLSPKLLFTLLFFLILYAFINHTPSNMLAPSAPAKIQMEKSYWLEKGWQTLDSYRHDLRDKDHFPMNLQWADSLENIQQHLTAQNWQLAERKFTRYFNWFISDSAITQLPMPPHVHAGQYERLAMIKYDKAERRVLIIRLWPTAIQITDTEKQPTPLWLGTVSYLEPVTRFWMRYLHTGTNVALYPQLIDTQGSKIKYREKKTNNGNGRVLLRFQE